MVLVCAPVLVLVPVPVPTMLVPVPTMLVPVPLFVLTVLIVQILFVLVVLPSTGGFAACSCLYLSGRLILQLRHVRARAV